MHIINRARVGTSAAAKRMEAAALAADKERARQQDERRRAQEEAARRDAEAREAEIGSQLDRNSNWTARQIEAWSRLQPDVVTMAKMRWIVILEETAQKHGLTVEDLVGGNRTRKFAHPRFEAMYRILAETTLSLPEIGRRLGGRDHTTVLYGVRTHAARNGLPMPRQDGEAA